MWWLVRELVCGAGRLAQAAIILNALVRLEFWDAAVFARVSQYVVALEPSALPRGRAAPLARATAAEEALGDDSPQPVSDNADDFNPVYGDSAEAEAGGGIGARGQGAEGREAPVAAGDIAMLVNAFSKVPDAAWLPGDGGGPGWRGGRVGGGGGEERGRGKLWRVGCRLSSRTLANCSSS